MRDEIVALEHKADRTVAVRIPVAVGEIFCRSPVYDKVAGGVLVKPSDYIEQCGFSAARRTEYRHEFAFAEADINAAQCGDLAACSYIVFGDVAEPEHFVFLPAE